MRNDEHHRPYAMHAQPRAPYSAAHEAASVSCVTSRIRPEGPAVTEISSHEPSVTHAVPRRTCRRRSGDVHLAGIHDRRAACCAACGSRCRECLRHACDCRGNGPASRGSSRCSTAATVWPTRIVAPLMAASAASDGALGSCIEHVGLYGAAIRRAQMHRPMISVPSARMHGAVHGVLEFTDVAEPGCALDTLARFVRRGCAPEAVGRSRTFRQSSQPAPAISRGRSRSGGM